MTYFQNLKKFNHQIRNELKLNRPDVGWYQIRQAFKLYEKQGELPLIDDTEFRKAYDILTTKLQPKIYEYGFLR